MQLRGTGTEQIHRRVGALVHRYLSDPSLTALLNLTDPSDSSVPPNLFFLSGYQLILDLLCR